MDGNERYIENLQKQITECINLGDDLVRGLQRVEDATVEILARLSGYLQNNS